MSEYPERRRYPRAGNRNPEEADRKHQVVHPHVEGEGRGPRDRRRGFGWQLRDRYVTRPGRGGRGHERRPQQRCEANPNPSRILCSPSPGAPRFQRYRRRCLGATWTIVALLPGCCEKSHSRLDGGAGRTLVSRAGRRGWERGMAPTSCALGTPSGHRSLPAANGTICQSSPGATRAGSPRAGVSRVSPLPPSSA
jgi:hypothetical protein